jgi:uncharacterized lipoprotein YddW (UPF0748 family)
VATVGNINWPSKPGLPVGTLKAELLAILDRAQSLNLNAVIFQVRPACDAMYESSLEPWSEYLTGKQGQAPGEGFDPLAFAVREAHRRGLELHAWFNPYRARHHSARSAPASNHISQRRPDIVRRYGNYLWLDPGMPASRQHSLEVIIDVVRRYDIDAVHFDDYFYPYAVKDAQGKDIPFPDEPSYELFGAGLPRSEWRRKNVDDFIREVQRSVHRIKPWVRFGVSPFGIWRPQHPPGITGLDAYEALHADARKWLRNGWVDYLVPQLYWTIDSPGQSFPKLMNWWQEQSAGQRHIWPGMNTANTVRTRDPWPPEEITAQIRLTRQAGLQGHVHWSYDGLARNDVLSKRLKALFYAEPAITPRYPWLDATAPASPKVDLDTPRQGPSTVKWTPGPGEPAHQWLVQVCSSGVWRTAVRPADAREYTVSGRQPEAVAVRAVDRCGNLSNATVVTPKR